MRAARLSAQRGVAVVTALLLTTLAITIVASLFWQQQVQVRSIENQRMQLQKQWVLRGALDWTKLILREDYRISGNVDHLGEPWAVPLAETRLDEYVDKQQTAEVPDATLSGRITDAQARFNLTNLCPSGKINPTEVAVFARLLSLTRQDPALAQAAADMMAAAQTQVQQAQGNQPGATANAGDSGSSQTLKILYPEDLLAVPGFTPEALAAIRDFIVVLPESTPINVNTAPAEVLAAGIDTLSLSEAAALVASRESAWFRNMGEFTQRLQGKSPGAGSSQLAVGTGYFLINGRVRLQRAGMNMQALIKRSGLNTSVVWIRED
jgi:general secretion pathway protein K